MTSPQPRADDERAPEPADAGLDATPPPEHSALVRFAAGPGAVLLGSALVAAQAARMRAWIVDDAAITFAYARSVAHGLGPVQQAGAPPVEGYSNPSWLTVLTLGHGLGLFDHGSLFGVSDLVWFPKLLALLCVAGVLWCVRATTGSAVATLFASVVLATNWSFVIWAFSGLENPLYGLLVAALAALLARAAVRGSLPGARTAALAGVLALLAALTRPDGLVYAGAYPLALVLTVPRSALSVAGVVDRVVRPSVLAVGVFGAPYGLFLLWRRAVFGQWVPNTAVAKAQGAPPLAQVWHQAVDVLGYAGWTSVAVVALAAALVLRRPGPARAELVAAGVPVGFAVLAFSVLQPDWMALYRFATPVWTAGALFGTLVLTRAWSSVRVAGSLGPVPVRLLARAALVVAAVGALILSALPQAASAATFRSWPTLSMCSVAQRYGLMFNAYADRLGLPPRSSSLLLPDLGGTLLTSELRVVDLAGLTDPVIARDYGAGDMAALRSYVFQEVRPTFVHVHGPWAQGPGLLPDTLRAEGYLAIYDSGTSVGPSAFDSDWVRTDAVTSPARLASLRGWAHHEVPTAERLRAVSPLTTCDLPTGIPR
ncbi:hypothetical protein DN069_18035 [Streptacidiphilus pinicola]|uniref:Glycosyltransferase RgtA/B/C/D-like domain-containing protein n=1 Tax=Streptacidiphilus pinicola TaxID=2219663 RepID=A0A2X0J223_9ACTN|nr:hypothetical protein [Streptacidiphilus pinicola]RAG84246.1 hypothetical protein DN069_18035 [Streptacidiphilus pinicola]